MTLYEQLKAKLARRDEIMAKAEEEGRGLSAEESTELKDIAATCRDLKEQIALNEELDDVAAEYTGRQGRKTAPTPIGGGAKPKDEKAEAMHGFESEGHYFKAVRAAADGRIDQRLEHYAAQGPMTNDGDQGYEVPPAISRQVFSVFDEDRGDLLSRVVNEQTNATSVKIPRDITNPWDAHGIKTHWEGTDAELKLSGLNATNSKTVELDPVSVFVKVHEDLLEDAPRLGARLLQMAPEKLRWDLNEVIRNGDGVAKPKGYRQSGAMITVAKESGQAAGSLTAKNILHMLKHLPPAMRSRAIWLANPDLEEELVLLKDDAGNLLFSSRDQSFTGGTPGTLRQLPLIWDDHAEQQGREGDLQLIVPEGYYFARRTGGPVFAQSMHLDFDKSTMAFRWRYRVGGDTFLDKPTDAAKGDTKRSHFIQLAARA